jgi:hypothetical protein
MLTKHRDEKEIYSVSFAPELAGDEVLSAPVVQVLGRGGVDVTAEFGTIVPDIQGPVVQFALAAAATAAAQVAEVYRVYIRVDTSANRTLVATMPTGGLPVLTVTA